MKKREFLSQLERALENKLSAQEIKHQLEYYETYIEEEVRKGQTEDEVLAMLGDPWAIAKTIQISSNISENEYQARKDDVTENDGERSPSGMKTGGINKILALVVIGVILIAILSIVFGLLAFVVRYAVPILIIALIIYIWKKK